MAKAPRIFTAEQVLAATQAGCGNCKWFRIEPTEDYGECWLMPPSPMVAMDENGEMTVAAVRPYVDLTDICSKWEPSQ